MALPYNSLAASNRRTIVSFFSILFAVVLFVLGTPTTSAQSGEMTFTIAPPLFQLSLQPGEVWSSSIAVVNQNPYPLTLYAEPVLFEPAGEDGRPSFINPEGTAGPSGASESSNIASWITVPLQGATIQAEQTYQLPIVITVPEEAPPGGHYAAILIGNRPPEGTTESTNVSVTSSIASLVFLSVAGDVVENGRIRDFVTEEYVYDTPEARLSMRFENQGNVHLLPQGDITIYNMWGKERGYIPINQGSNYGNVLPGSMRKYTFNWKADTGIWDIGRYRAEATLGYGREAKQFASATIHFYVLPILPLIELFLALVFFVYFLGWAIRAYVRRALALEAAKGGTRPEQTEPEQLASETEPYAPQEDVVEEAPTEEPAELHLGTLIRPIQSGLVDLRRIGGSEDDALQHDADIAALSNRFSVAAFVREYRFFFLFIIVISAAWIAANAFLSDVLTYDSEYEVTIEHPDGTEVELSTE